MRCALTSSGMRQSPRGDKLTEPTLGPGGWPAAYFGADTWLEDFAYRTEFNPSLFAASGAAVLIVVWLTVGYQALRATRDSPGDALRYE